MNDVYRKVTIISRATSYSYDNCYCFWVVNTGVKSANDDASDNNAQVSADEVVSGSAS